jgi:hypothetical protein
MADTVKIDLEENSKYRVAYDLMRLIVNHEKIPADLNERREYLLTAYHQCIMVVENQWTVNDLKSQSGQATLIASAKA